MELAQRRRNLVCTSIAGHRSNGSGYVVQLGQCAPVPFGWFSPVAAGRTAGDRRNHGREADIGPEPDYDLLFTVAKISNPNWATISINIADSPNELVRATVDTGNGGQPQKRIQYLLNRNTGSILKTINFADGSLGERLRAFVRFGHTGEYYGWPGQMIAALSSIAACVLVYTGLALAIRRFAAKLKRRQRLWLQRVTHTREESTAYIQN